MAVRARLTPPQEIRQEWPWHKLQTASFPASLLLQGQRRMEAETYLTSGYSVQRAIEAKPHGWRKLSDAASIWQPSRLKGIVVSSEYGTPFLAATQIFDIRPTPRKWLSIERTNNAAERFLRPSTIIMTRSGSVGRATISLNCVENTLITDDLLRVEPYSDKKWGWIYAYLRSPIVRQILQSSQYGHVIKHLEVPHVNDIPIIDAPDHYVEYFYNEARKIFAYRNEAIEATEKAERLLSIAMLKGESKDASRSLYTVETARSLSGERRRLEASFYSPEVRFVLTAMEKNANSISTLRDVTEGVWWMSRFRRYFGDGGVPYMSADELFSISQIGQKRVYIDPIQNHHAFYVKSGWILMACSGQVYGLNGSVTLATKADEEYFFSHDLIRIAPKLGCIRPGYLFAFLGHPELGRPLVLRNAYGSSVPHLEPADVGKIPIPRFNAQIEDEIADLAERASALRAEARETEKRIGDEASQLVSSFIR